jgi:hypothetical protein
MGIIITDLKLPSYKYGHAGTKGNTPQNANLWNKLEWAVHSGLGFSGNSIPDLTGRGNHAQLSGMDPTNWQVNTKIGRELSADGSDERLEASGKWPNLTGINNWSMAVWARTNVKQNNKHVMTMRGDENPSGNELIGIYGCETVQSGGSRVFYRGTTILNYSGQDFSDDVYHLWVLLQRGDAQQELWIDGTLRSSDTTASKTLTDVTHINLMGWYTGSSQNMSGHSGVGAVWSRDLQPTEIAQLYRDYYAIPRIKERKTKFFLLPQAPGDPDTTGDVSITLASLWMNNPNIIQLPVLSVQGGSGATGNITLPLLSVEGGQPAGSFNVIGNADITLPLLFVDNQNEGSVVLPIFTVSAEQVNRANSNITLPIFTTETVVQQGSVESIAITLPQLVITAYSGHKVALTLPSLNVISSGSNGYLGTFDRMLPSLVVNVKANQAEILTGDITLPLPLVNASAVQGVISTGGNRILPMLLINAHGFKGRNGDGDITLPALSVVGVGFANPTGDVPITLPIIELNAFADVYTNRII